MNLQEEGMGLAGLGLSNVPTTTVGNGGFTDAGDPKTKGGYNKPLQFVRRKRKKIKEEVVDSNTKESQKRFEKIAKAQSEKPKRNPEDDTVIRFSESKIIKEDVYDNLYKIYLSKKSGKVIFKDKSTMLVDYDMAVFLVTALSNMGPEQYKILRRMLNNNILNFIATVNLIKRNL